MPNVQSVRCAGSFRPAIRRYVETGRVIACPQCGADFPELDADRPGAPLPAHAPPHGQSVREELESATLYVVDHYAYGDAHSSDGEREHITTDLASALDALGDEVDAYADYLHEGSHEIRAQMYALAEMMAGDSTDEDREELEYLGEIDREYSSAIAFADALYSSLQGWANVANGGHAPVGQLEYLERYLQRTHDHAEGTLPRSGARLVADIVEDLDAPDSISAGRTFAITTTSVAELGGIDALEEHAPELLDRLREELQDSASA